jgi:hypothetical protein
MIEPPCTSTFFEAIFSTLPRRVLVLGGAESKVG